MPLRIDRVKVEEKQILENLLQMYLHEMSQYSADSVDSHGQFTYPYLDAYFEEDERDAYLIRVKGLPAGFVMVRKMESLSDHPIHSIAEFFVLNSYRRLGIGEEIARQVLNQYHGLWQVGVLSENKEGQYFWHKVAYRYTGNDYKTSRIAGWDGPVFEFNSPSNTFEEDTSRAFTLEENKGFEPT